MRHCDIRSLFLLIANVHCRLYLFYIHIIPTVIRHPEHEEQTISFTIVQGQTTELIIALVKKVKFE